MTSVRRLKEMRVPEHRRDTVGVGLGRGIGLDIEVRRSGL